MSVSNKLVVTYGSEMTLQKTDENSLSVYQRKALRKILGPCKYGKIGTEIVISQPKYCRRYYQEDTQI